MRIMIKKSVAKAICKRWGFPLVLKAYNPRDPKFEYFKRKILEHLEKLERKEKAQMRKSLAYLERLEKAQKRNVGDIVTWGRKVKHEYIKGADGKWRRYYRGTSRGQKLSIAALKRKVDACKDTSELWDLVFANWGRFMDTDGMPLPVVRELHAYASKREDEITAAERKKKEEEGETIVDDIDFKKLSDDRLNTIVSTYESLLNNALNNDEKFVSLREQLREIQAKIKNTGGKISQQLWYQRNEIQGKVSDRRREIERSFQVKNETLYNNSVDAKIEIARRGVIAEAKRHAEEYMELNKRRGGYNYSNTTPEVLFRVANAKRAGAEELIANFSQKDTITIHEIKTLFDYCNRDAATAELFDKVYEKVKDNNFVASVGSTRNNALGETFFDGRVRYSKYLFEEGFFSQVVQSGTLLHELLHHVTNQCLHAYENRDFSSMNTEQRDACKTLNNVFELIKTDENISNEYGVSNIHEMVAELSNVRFREKLKKKNLWTVIVDAVAKIVGVFKRGCKAANALETAEGALYKLLDNYKPYGDKGEGEGEPLALKIKREVRHDGEYVLTSRGSKDFGEITQEIADSIGKQAGKIRLRRGIEHERDNKGGYGEKHIEREGRKQQLEKAGYANARDFVEDVCSNFNKVYQNGGGLLLVKETGRLVCAIGLESSKDGNFYDVKTAHIAREGYYKKKRLLWESPSNLHKSESSKAPTLKSSYATPRAFSEYPDAHMIPQSAKNASEISKKYQKKSLRPRFMVRKSVARQILRQEHTLCKH